MGPFQPQPIEPPADRSMAFYSNGSADSVRLGKCDVPITQETELGSYSGEQQALASRTGDIVDNLSVALMGHAMHSMRGPSSGPNG